MNKNCQECGDNLIGRSDKKFCDSNCRSAYNNRHHQLRNNITRSTIKILKQNRQILWANYTQGLNQLSLKLLIGQGFKIGYITRQTEQSNMVLNWCFDMAYAEWEPNKILVVSIKDQLQSEDRLVLI